MCGCSRSVSGSPSSPRSRRARSADGWLVILADVVVGVGATRALRLDRRRGRRAARGFRFARRDRDATRAGRAAIGRTTGRRRSIARTPRSAADSSPQGLSHDQGACSRPKGDSLDIYQWVFNKMVVVGGPKPRAAARREVHRAADRRGPLVRSARAGSAMPGVSAGVRVDADDRPSS